MRTSVGKRKGIRANKTRIVLFCVTVLMCVFACVSLFLFIRSFLPVKSFELSGVTQYERSEIIWASGIKEGDKLYSVDLEAAAERLLESCPYLESSVVERKFPSRIVFKVTEKTPHWYIEISGDYYTLDENFVVIEETVNRDKLVNGGVPELILPDLRKVVCGEVPDFGKDEHEVEKAMELVSAVQSTGFKARLTLVDMESRFDVNIVVENRYFVYMGDISNVKEKLKAVEKILATEEFKSYAGAEIDASMPETVSVKPIYSYDQ